MKILVTGSNGFIGKNLIANLSLRPGVQILTYDVQDVRETLQAHLQQADFVCHLAGVNRPLDPSEFVSGNTDLTVEVVRQLETANRPIPLLLSSSIQAALDNPYGNSKRAAEEAAALYAQRTGASVYRYRLPNVFGKWCRPNYNSVVATFCHNVAHGLACRVDDPDKTLTLVYIDDVVDEFVRALEGKVAIPAGGFCGVEPQHSIALGELASLIADFGASRENLTHVRDRSDPLVAKLYATYLSYLPQDGFAVAADMKFDARGFFAELIKSPCFGQISVSRTKPGITRGNHWHNTKVEKFIVIEGDAVIRFRKIGTDEVLAYSVSGKNIEIVDIPPGYTHSIANVGDTDVLTIFWSGELFDPDKPDTYYLEV